MSIEEIKRHADEFLDKQYDASKTTQPTEEELYWKRMAQSNAQLGYTNQGIGGWQQGGYHGALQPPNALDPRMNQGPDPRSVAMPKSAFEERMQRIEKTQEHETSQLTTLFYRLERLDESMRSRDSQLGDFGRKLAELREWDDEQERKERWQLTYNACVRIADDSANPEMEALYVENAHRLATMQAERAHGPLEPSNQSGASKPLRPGAFNQMDALRGVKLDGPAVDEGPFIQSIKFIDSREMYTMYKRGDVDALVQAASDAWVYLNTLDDGHSKRLVSGLLAGALKPFKRSE